MIDWNERLKDCDFIEEIVRRSGEHNVRYTIVNAGLLGGPFLAGGISKSGTLSDLQNEINRLQAVHDKIKSEALD